MSGRWHTHPKPVVYCAAEPHTAFRELLRYISHELLFPDDMKMLKIRVPKGLGCEVVDIDELDPLWNDKAVGYSICQPIGNSWLEDHRTALLRVPSVTERGRHNVLLNPAHLEADELKVVEVYQTHPFPDFIRLPEH